LIRFDSVGDDGVKTVKTGKTVKNVGLPFWEVRPRMDANETREFTVQGLWFSPDLGPEKDSR